MNKQEYENKINDFLKKWKLTPETKEIFTEIAVFVFKNCVIKNHISFGNKKTEKNVSEPKSSRGFFGSIIKLGEKKGNRKSEEEQVNVFDFLKKIGFMLKNIDEKYIKEEMSEKENRLREDREQLIITNNLMNDLNGANAKINNLVNDLNRAIEEIRFLDGKYQNFEETVGTWIQYNYETDLAEDLAERLNIKFVSEEENSGFPKEELFIYSENKGKDRPAIVRLNIKGEMKIIVQGMKYKN